MYIYIIVFEMPVANVYIQKIVVLLKNPLKTITYPSNMMIKIKKIEFAYSYARYHANAGINNFTIATNVNRFIGSNKINNDDRE